MKSTPLHRYQGCKKKKGVASTSLNGQNSEHFQRQVLVSLETQELPALLLGMPPP